MRTYSLDSAKAVTSVLAIVCLAGCNQANSKPAGSTVGKPFAGAYPIKAVCTTGMVADLVRNTAKGHVDPVTLMGEGVDPHLYRASPGDITRLNAADIIFYSGLHLEGKMADIFVQMARKKPTYAVTERVPPERLIEVQDGFHDPHCWFDVSLWSEAAAVVRDVLIEFDPSHAEEYRANASAYQGELAKLHEYCKEQLALVPKERRVLVTAHDAFHYFGRAYGVEVKAIQGVSTEGEASVKEINELVEFITSRGIKAVFVESSVSDRNIKALVEGCQARNHKVAIGGELFSDAMGKDGTPEGTYIGMVRHNVDTIIQALR